MNPLLILREEIVCLIILGFFALNSRFYRLGKDSDSFRKIWFFATGHVLFDIITVLTVNHLDAIPAWLNFTAHTIFYLFAILFAREFFCYVISLCLPKAVERKLRAGSLALLICYLVVLPGLPIEYLHGNGTNYSFGFAAFVGYAIALLLFIASMLTILWHFKRLERHVRYALIPMLVAMITAECIQIAVPEFLFTGGAITIITVGFFFSLENPSFVFKKKHLIDAHTGVKNRNSYEMDIARMEREYKQNPRTRYGMVFVDINNLKLVNDLYGHLEGDDYIGSIARSLLKNLHSAEGVYRMGGDEFLAIYRNKSEKTILQEIEQVHAYCKQKSTQLPYKASVAIGYAISEANYTSLREVLKVADYMMYQDKAEIKKAGTIISTDKT